MEAACDTFQDSGIACTWPIGVRRVLDVFLLPESRGISADGLRMLDETGSPLNGGMEGAAGMAP